MFKSIKLTHRWLLCFHLYSFKFFRLHLFLYAQNLSYIVQHISIVYFITWKFDSC